MPGPRPTCRASPASVRPGADVSDALRRLERRIVLRARLRDGARRVVESLPAILQIVVAVLAAYAITHLALGHALPILAVTVTINSLGLTRDARPRRVLETLTGIVLGVATADALGLLLGSGIWQLAIVLVVVFVVGRFVAPNPQFAVAAAVPSGLVTLLPAADPFGRTLDAAVAGAVALAVTALLPRDPRRAAARDRRRIVAVLVESTESVVTALRDGDEAAAEVALARLRRAHPLLEAWRASLDTAIAVARISPFLRARLPDLRRDAQALEALDLALRHLRTIARRCGFLVRDGVARPGLADPLQSVAVGIGQLGAELDDPLLAGSTRSVLADLARRLAPARLLPEAGIADAAALLLLRPLVVDLLIGTGMTATDARELLPPV